jgi:hypothetical protein
MLLGDTSIKLYGPAEEAWHKVVDWQWQTMPEWDIFMERLNFDGPLRLGSVGKLKMKDGPEVTLVVTSFDPPHSYTDEFSLLGSKFVFHHEITEFSGGSILRIWVEGHGFLAALLGPLLRNSFASKMPFLMNNFKQQFEHATTGSKPLPEMH